MGAAARPRLGVLLVVSAVLGSLCALGSPGVAGAVPAVTLYVNTTGTATTGCTGPTGAKACPTIQDGVAAAEALGGDAVTVTVGPGTYPGATVVAASGLASLTLHGAGEATTKVTGAEFTRDIAVVGGTVTIEGFTIRGGAQTFGGGVYNAATLTLDDDTLTSDSAGTQGGAVYNSATMTLTDDLFTTDSSLVDGGGVFSTGTITASGNTFSHDTADLSGGGIEASGRAALTGNTFSHDSAAGSGGGATLTGTATVTGNTFSTDQGSFGGGLGVSGHAASVTANTFSRDAASTQGGGLIVTLGTVVVSDDRFTNDTATVAGTGGVGGAIADRAIGTTLVLSGDVFSTDSALRAGGGLYSLATVTSSGNTFTQDQAKTYYGGGGMSTAADLHSFDDAFVKDSAPGWFGGGILSTTATLTDDVFSTDTANFGGGGVAGGGILGGGTTTLTGDTFTNDSSASGGGVDISGTATFIDDTFSTDHGYPAAGGIYDDLGTLTLTGDTFTKDTAGEEGGAIENGTGSRSGTINATNDTFATDTSGLFGGAVYDTNGPVHLTDDTFLDDTAGRTGGAMYATSRGSSTIVASILDGSGCAGAVTGSYDLVTTASCADLITSTNPPTVTASALDLASVLGHNTSPGSETLAIGPTSVAINSVPHAQCASTPALTVDQRGDPRPGDTTASHLQASCDAGAYELQHTIGVLRQGTPRSGTVAQGTTSFRLKVSNPPSSTGKVSFALTSSAVTGVTVSSTGTIHAAPTTAIGTYTLSGTDSDRLGDTGTWTFTLHVETALPFAFAAEVTTQTSATVAFGTPIRLGETGLPATAGGTVTFYAGTGDTTELCSFILSTSATSCTPKYTVDLSPRAAAYVIHATWTGAPGHPSASATLTVGKATAPAFTVTVTAATSATAPYHATVHFEESGLPATAGGTVSFREGSGAKSALCSFTLSGGTTSCTYVDGLPPSATAYEIHASWTGGADYKAGTSGSVALTVTVVTKTSFTAFTPGGSASAVYGLETALTVTVTVFAATGIGNPTGAVSIETSSTSVVGTCTATSQSTGFSDYACALSTSRELGPSATPYVLHAAYAGGASSTPGYRFEPSTSRTLTSTVSLSVDKATIDVTTVGGSKIYGSTVPDFSGTYDAAGASVTGSVTCATLTTGSPTTAHLAAGTYTVKASSCSGLTATTGDYVFSYSAEPTGFTVDPATIDVTTVGGSKTYGSTTATFSGTYDAAGASVTGSVTCATLTTGSPTTAHLAAGSYTVKASSCSGLTATTGDYVFSYVAAPTGFAVAKGTIAVNTVQGSQTYESSAPVFRGVYDIPHGATVDGALTCADVTAGTRAISATLTPGTYTIKASSCSGLTATTGDYVFSYAAEPTGFTVDPATIDVTTVTGSQTYGSSAPVFRGVYDIPHGASVAGALTCADVTAGTRAISATLTPGTYTIKASSCSGLTATTGDYVFSYVAAPTGFAVTNAGYDLVGQDGGVFVFNPPGVTGGFYGSLPGIGVVPNKPVVGMVPTVNDQGYFLVAQDGGVFSFGNAPFLGSLPGIGVTPAQPIVGIIAAKTDTGYYLVGRDGGVFAFGTVPFLGSLPGTHVDVDNVIGIAAMRSGAGYWVVRATGAVYAFGAAKAFPPTAATSTVTAIAGTATGGGYWLVTQDGGVIPYGTAAKMRRGTLPSIGVRPVEPVIGIVPTSSTTGYWLLSEDGGIFAFGTAPYYGSLPTLGVSVTDIVGAVPN